MERVNNHASFARKLKVICEKNRCKDVATYTVYECIKGVYGSINKTKYVGRFCTAHAKKELYKLWDKEDENAKQSNTYKIG